MDSGGPKQSVEEITDRLGDMSVNMIDVELIQPKDSNPPIHHFNDSTNLQHCQFIHHQQDQYLASNQSSANAFQYSGHQNSKLDENEEDEENERGNRNYALIVTNVDPMVFHDDFMKAKFESLFLAYGDSNTVKFRYLKSFKRIRIDFKDHQSAEAARMNLDRYKLGQNQFRCYNAQIINLQRQSNEAYQYLKIPKLTKQFLISPPASPPVGWEPVNEGTPCIDVQLISAIANLVPGKVHEIHPASESQPGIFVEVCEDAEFDALEKRSKASIPKTPNPSFQLQTAMDSG